MARRHAGLKSKAELKRGLSGMIECPVLLDLYPTTSMPIRRYDLIASCRRYIFFEIVEYVSFQIVIQK